MYEAASWGDAAGVLWVLERVALGLAKHRDNAELLPQTAPTPDHTLQVGDDAIFLFVQLSWPGAALRPDTRQRDQLCNSWATRTRAT